MNNNRSCLGLIITILLTAWAVKFLWNIVAVAIGLPTIGVWTALALMVLVNLLIGGKNKC